MTERNVEIIFDTRERYLIEAFRQKYPGVDHKVEQLHVGDIHFKVDGTVSVVIERKTLDDLSASIMDHRWQEQKKRLGELDTLSIYIMEGIEKSNKKGISYDTLISAMWSTIVRDKQHVFRTCNLHETALSVYLIYNKLLKQQGTGHENSAIVSQLSSGNKKGLYTKDNIWTAQLACIPGLSFNLAKKITREYKSFEILYNTYIEKNRSMSFLCDIPKIGKKISQNIEDFLF
jgi:ERCC4-type nuclease